MAKHKIKDYSSMLKDLITIVVIILFVAAFFVFSSYTPKIPANVIVSGTVTTNPLTTPVKVIFTNATIEYQAHVTYGLKYSTKLPANEIYSVTVMYSPLLFGQNGTCNAGTLRLGNNQSSYQYNPTCWKAPQELASGIANIMKYLVNQASK